MGESYVTYWVEHYRTDCGETYAMESFYPTDEERDEHARILREEDPEAFDIRTWEVSR